MKLINFTALLAILLLTNMVSAQPGNGDARSRPHLGLARVDPKTLGVGFEIPLIAYPGRGSAVSVAVRYSSDVWRFRRTNSRTARDSSGGCTPVSEAGFSENSASGWTTSLAAPYVEYLGLDARYDTDGHRVDAESSGCEPTGSELSWVRRIRLHLPGGNTHELRMDDEVLTYPRSSECRDSGAQTNCSRNDPSLPGNSSGWYYAADGSNIRYFEDRTANVYFAQMPDGSRYDFSSAMQTDVSPSRRMAIVRTDRNGNAIVYHDATEEFPNGRLTDSVGRSIPAPFLPQAPATPGDRSVELPGFDGGVSRFIFRWKRLKGASPGESAVDDFDSDLNLAGDHVFENGIWRPSDMPSLFRSDATTLIGGPNEPFNPVLLTEIELPSGAKYSFRYNNFGEMVRADLPTGGYESFKFSQSDRLTGDPAAIRGVKRHVISPGNGIENQWTYSRRIGDAKTYRVDRRNPDGTSVVSFVNRENCEPRFGFEDVLAGTVAEERIYAASGRLVASRTANWTKTDVGRPFGTISRNPRIASIESLIRDRSGTQFRSFESIEYVNEPELDSPDQRLLIRSLKRSYGGADTVDTKKLEFTYAVDDPAIPAELRSGYRSNGLAGLVGSVSVFDDAGVLISKAVSRYDEPGFGPRGPHGNRTSFEIWEKVAGDPRTVDSDRRSTVRFDDYGNAIETVDPNGTVTRTEFDESAHAFPLRITTIIPGTGVDLATSATIENRFDAVLGLPIWTRDPGGKETKFRYEPRTGRLTGLTNFRPGDDAEIVTELTYRDTPGAVRISRRTRADDGHWSESAVSFDGLGRPVRIDRSSPGGTTFVDLEFDAFGRIERISSPYRGNEKAAWTTYVYDETGRGVEIIRPDGKSVPVDWGVIMGDLSRTDWGVLVGDLSRTDWGVLVGDLSHTDWGVLVGDIAQPDWGVIMGDLSRTDWGVIMGDLSRTDWGVIMGDLSRTDWGVLVGDLTGTNRF